MWFKKNLNVLAVVGACIIIYLLFNKEIAYVEEYNNRITALENKVDSLHQVNDDLNVKICSLVDSIEKVDIQITQKDKEINKLQHEINTQINSVNSFNNTELKEFFTNRYGQCLDPTLEPHCETNN